MIKIFEKHWLLISMLFLLAVLASFILFHTIAQPLSWILIIAGIGIAVFFSVRRNFQSFQQGKFSRASAIRNILIEILGMLLSIAAAVWLTGKAASWIVPTIAYAVEAAKPGLGMPIGMLAGLLIALCVGLGVGVLMRALLKLVSGGAKSQ